MGDGLTHHQTINQMPRLSARKEAIRRARKLFRCLVRSVALTGLSDSDSSDGSRSSAESSEGSSQHDALFFSWTRLRRIETHRYYRRVPYRCHTKADTRFRDDLEDLDSDDDRVPWLNDTEFLGKYRMTRPAFRALLSLIEDDPIFQPKYKRGRKQRPVEQQLLMALAAFGGEGSAFSASHLREVFGNGRGTSLVYMRRVVHAIRNKREQLISWPDEQERKEIARRIQDLSGLPNCIGIVDGTLFPLAFRPRTVDAPDYKGRRLGYTITSIIVCDDQRLIRYYVAGWPGSTHDNRVAKNTLMWNAPDTFFKKHQYIIGDSAFENLWFMVSAFTSAPGNGMLLDQSAFNTCLSRARVISEHTIGLLKGRFPWLRSIRKIITEDDKTLNDILLFLDASVLMHNFLVQRGLDEAVADWFNEEDDASLIDEYDRLPEDDELNQPVPDGLPGDFRRTQLLYYLQEQGLIQ